MSKKQKCLEKWWKPLTREEKELLNLKRQHEARILQEASVASSSEAPQALRLEVANLVQQPSVISGISNSVIDVMDLTAEDDF